MSSIKAKADYIYVFTVVSAISNVFLSLPLQKKSELEIPSF